MDSQRHNSIRSFGTLAAPALALRLRRRVGKYSSFSTGPAVPARSYANTQSDHMGARHYIRLAWPRSRYSRRSWKAEIWHLEDVRSACGVERVWPLQETRERLAVLTVADEAEAAGRRDIACNAAHVAAPAPKREVQRQACHINASDHESAPVPIPPCRRAAPRCQNDRRFPSCLTTHTTRYPRHPPGSPAQR